jgi:hypothetical protein
MTKNVKKKGGKLGKRWAKATPNYVLTERGTTLNHFLDVVFPVSLCYMCPMLYRTRLFMVGSRSSPASRHPSTGFKVALQLTHFQ